MAHLGAEQAGPGGGHLLLQESRRGDNVKSKYFHRTHVLTCGKGKLKSNIVKMFSFEDSKTYFVRHNYFIYIVLLIV